MLTARPVGPHTNTATVPRLLLLPPAQPVSQVRVSSYSDTNALLEWLPPSSGPAPTQYFVSWRSPSIRAMMTVSYRPFSPPAIILAAQTYPKQWSLPFPLTAARAT